MKRDKIDKTLKRLDATLKHLKVLREKTVDRAYEHKISFHCTFCGYEISPVGKTKEEWSRMCRVHNKLCLAKHHPELLG